MTREPARRRRGQPVAMLALIMTIWVGARGWLVARDAASIEVHRQFTRTGRMVSAAPASQHRPMVAAAEEPSPTASTIAGRVTRAPADRPLKPSHAGAGVMAIQGLRFRLPPPVNAGPVDARATAGLSPRRATPQDQVSRWSDDGWLLLRGSGGTAASAAGAAAYGASQAGAVLRYRLAGGNSGSPYAYLRASTAIGTAVQDRELAAGLGARPLAHLPIRLLFEARARDGTDESPMSIRPALFAVTELPRHDLPSGFRAEAYAQVGYVAGRNATPFFDTQLVVDHPASPDLLPALDPRIGFGIWSGGQRGAARLDLGPRASIRLDAIAGKPLVLALDWRLRAAGSALPDSGPTLIVASSF